MTATQIIVEGRLRESSRQVEATYGQAQLTLGAALNLADIDAGSITFQFSSELVADPSFLRAVGKGLREPPTDPVRMALGDLFIGFANDVQNAAKVAKSMEKPKENDDKR